jgi:hypothetical protein
VQIVSTVLAPPAQRQRVRSQQLPDRTAPAAAGGWFPPLPRPAAARSRCPSPQLLGIMKHLSSCLQLTGVAGHPAGGSAEALGESTARFEHDRPEGLEGMSGSYRAEMWRRLHIRIVLSRMRCFIAPHQDQRLRSRSPPP